MEANIDVEYTAALEIIRKENMGLSKKNHKEGKEFANEQMTAVLNWDVLCCSEFATGTFMEMVLRSFFCLIISLLILVNIGSVLVKFFHIR